ncbi:MAG: tagatose 1,6-diphosphate aldolase [Anaerolineae bacterium]
MITLGKYRHLTQSSTAAGHFIILAIDHRANLLSALNKHRINATSDQEFMHFKLQVMKYLLPSASAVLTDPNFGVGQGITDGVISGKHGILAPLEETNYDVYPSQRQTNFIQGWSVEKIKRIGGSGVKLLLYYHPDDPTAPQKRTLVSKIVDQCRQFDIPFFLEPIAYSLDSERPLSTSELRQVVVDSAREFSASGVDILKLEFPINPYQESDEAVWLDACMEVDSVCSIPWTILSAGVSFEIFRRQARIACQAGASGVIVGRAVWNEAVELQGAHRLNFLQSTACKRIEELSLICEQNAVDWRERVPSPQLTPNWYETYY